jgi:hypothetical protein
MRIDCDECVMQHTTACDECVVTFIVERPRHEAVVLDLAEERAVRRLEEAGLVPGLLYMGRGG